MEGVQGTGKRLSRRVSVGSTAGKVLEEAPLFSAIEDMKAKCRASLCKPTYNVTDYYSKTGFCQSMARSGLFENLTLAVIFLNGIWIAIDTDYNDKPLLKDAHPVFLVAENIFCAFFVAEILIRFGAFSRKRDALQDFWFVFDSFLVCLMVGETWILTVVTFVMDVDSGVFGNTAMFRLVRLVRLPARMARMVRVLHAIPELLILIKGIAAAMRAVFFTLILLFIVLYLFGVFMTQLADGEVGKEHFGTVPQSMYTLIIAGVFMDDLGALILPLGREDPICAVLFWLFVLAGSICIMNMLLGILVEVVSAVSSAEKEALSVTILIDNLRQLTPRIGLHEGSRISRENVASLLELTETMDCMRVIGVDTMGFIESMDSFFLDSDGSMKTLSFEDFVEVLLSFRGNNPTKVTDVVALRKFMHKRFDMIESNIQRILSLVEVKPSVSPKRGSFRPKPEPFSTPLSGLQPMHLNEVNTHEQADLPTLIQAVRSSSEKKHNNKVR
eukprot:TRINITY_DN7949_c1_g1_i3.p1 TRINITY_DN7949_c1_g1~~TRINITY_DN7949_c1_g1_i3.p1  ORF type:complete len:535 (+),score=56.54 TRINITY_DN7949_c1_g1_i3:107-1606(+)